MTIHTMLANVNIMKIVTVPDQIQIIEVKQNNDLFQSN